MDVIVADLDGNYADRCSAFGLPKDRREIGELVQVVKQTQTQVRSTKGRDALQEALTLLETFLSENQLTEAQRELYSVRSDCQPVWAKGRFICVEPEMDLILQEAFDDWSRKQVVFTPRYQELIAALLHQSEYRIRLGNERTHHFNQEMIQPMVTTPASEASAPTTITPLSRATLQSLPEVVQKLKDDGIFTGVRIIKVGDAPSLSLRGTQSTGDFPHILVKHRSLDEAGKHLISSVVNWTRRRKRFTLLGDLRDLTNRVCQNETHDGNIDVALGDDGYSSNATFTGDEDHVDSPRGGNSDQPQNSDRHDVSKSVGQWVNMASQWLNKVDSVAAADALIEARDDDDRQSVMTFTMPSISCDDEEIAALEEVVQNYTRTLQDEEPEERWKIVVDYIVRPWLVQSPSVQRIFSQYGVGTDAFKNHISTRVRLTMLDRKLLKVVFGDDAESANLPFAKSFKLSWNEVHSKTKPSLTLVSDAEAKTMVIDALYNVMSDVFRRSSESHAQSKEPTHRTKSGTPFLLGPAPGSKKSQKTGLVSIPEQGSMEGSPSSAEMAKKELGKWAVTKRNPGLPDRLASASGTFTKPPQPQKSASDLLKR